MIVRCDFKVQWSAFRDPETGYWIGECPPLGLVAEGETWAELSADALAAMQLLLHHLLGTGELSRFLDEKGWHCEGLPVGESRENVTFDIPAWIVPQAGPSAQVAPSH